MSDAAAGTGAEEDDVRQSASKPGTATAGGDDGSSPADGGHGTGASAAEDDAPGPAEGSAAGAAPATGGDADGPEAAPPAGDAAEGKDEVEAEIAAQREMRARIEKR
ncbi:hypothetical protein HW130_20155, partial [Streptomyces sp. PKU-EA00015]|nr:hypothetical protein [Streptomyces sp. PKU-EA00015]